MNVVSKWSHTIPKLSYLQGDSCLIIIRLNTHMDRLSDTFGAISFTYILSCILLVNIEWTCCLSGQDLSLLVYVNKFYSK